MKHKLVDDIDINVHHTIDPEETQVLFDHVEHVLDKATECAIVLMVVGTVCHILRKKI